MEKEKTTTFILKLFIHYLVSYFILFFYFFLPRKVVLVYNSLLVDDVSMTSRCYFAHLISFVFLTKDKLRQLRVPVVLEARVLRQVSATQLSRHAPLPASHWNGYLRVAYQHFKQKLKT